MNDEEARAPRFRTEVEDDAGNVIHPDWSVVVSNQFTEITQNSSIIENQKVMISELQKIIVLWDEITKRQSTMVTAISSLAEQMDKARAEIKSSLTSIIQVPITVTIIGVASWAFFMKYIEEYTWLIICAVAAFRYLGDSISGVLKLIGLRRTGNGN
jgi:hypothetical protein